MSKEETKTPEAPAPLPKIQKDVLYRYTCNKEGCNCALSFASKDQAVAERAKLDGRCCVEGKCPNDAPGGGEQASA